MIFKISSLLFKSTDKFSALFNVPALPGAQNILEILSSFDKDQTIECSRPPDPRTNILFMIYFSFYFKFI